MKCLIYILTPRSDQQQRRNVVADQVRLMKRSARVRGWKTVGLIVDERKEVRDGEYPPPLHLLRSLNEHPEVGAVIVMTGNTMDSAECAAVKAVLERQELTLVMVTHGNE